MQIMNWDSLLSSMRTGQEDRANAISHNRTQFQRDYDRLIFSSPFRRLQNKTQVFPLPGSVFVHNRLTHSLEVASVGRSLGNNIAEFLHSKGEDNELIQEINSVVAAACLAHDMGNPPFGHSGETAMSQYFKYGEGAELIKNHDISEQQYNDLINFEGNANTFRILTHQFKGRRQGGFCLTYTTVASILKYPYSSSHKGKKKYGHFCSETSMFNKVAEHLQLVKLEEGTYARHPLVYLVEAADDICYEIMDLEDAHKLSIISTAEVKDIMMAFLAHKPEMFKKIDEMSADIDDLNEYISYIRASVIGVLVEECTMAFKQNYDSIMQGKFKGSLTEKLSPQVLQAMNDCKKQSFSRIYRHPSVMEVEISGFKILGSLLHEFSQAVLNRHKEISTMLLAFMPEQFKVSDDADAYTKLQSVLDFISGMTDVYALDLFQKINGIGLANKGY